MKKLYLLKSISLIISFILIIIALSGCGRDTKTIAQATNDNEVIADDYFYDIEESSNYNSYTSSQSSIVQNAPPKYNYKFEEIIEKEFTVTTNDNNTSTFSLDRNTASYTLMRNQINNGLKIDEESVRIEEYINYFNYNYEHPSKDKELAISGGLFDCPWNSDSKLFSIGVAAETIDFKNAKSNNIVFLLDTSGSMYGEDRLGLIQQSFTMLLEYLKKDDTVSIVTYAGDTKVLLEGGKGYEKTTIASILQDLEASGSTAGANGIELAYNVAKKYYDRDKNNRVILATDGDFNVGISSIDALKKFISEKRESGIYLSVLGVGMGNTSDSIMKTLAENGNGNYAYLDNVTEAKRVLVNELGGTMNTVAKNAKINITFNTDAVSSFRLIGYESKMMSLDDFNDVNKDAGEIGSGHTVTALYEVKLKSEVLNKNIKIANAEIRYQTPEKEPKNINVLKDFTTKDYKKVTNEDMKFISAVAEFGLILRKSEYRNDASIDAVIKRLEGLECVKTDQFKAEFLELCKKSRKIY